MSLVTTATSGCRCRHGRATDITSAVYVSTAAPPKSRITTKSTNATSRLAMYESVAWLCVIPCAPATAPSASNSST